MGKRIFLKAARLAVFELLDLIRADSLDKDEFDVTGRMHPPPPEHVHTISYRADTSSIWIHMVEHEKRVLPVSSTIINNDKSELYLSFVYDSQLEFHHVDFIETKEWCGRMWMVVVDTQIRE